MSFICKNIDCSAPENKKGKVYPSDMECPFCDAPLVEVLSFNEADLKLINSLPYVIAHPLKRAITEKHAWTRINLLKDTFLNYLKYLGLITATEFFKSDLKDKKMVALFHASLAEPSFGTWNLYIRETIAYLNQNNHSFFCPELPRYYEGIETGKKRKLYTGEIEFIDGNGDVQLKKQEATAIGMLINFRNRYLGHGLTLDEDASKKLWDEYYPMFNQLLTQLNFPIEYPMFKHEHGETYLLQSSELSVVEKGNQSSASVWMENPSGQAMDILPFFIVPGELALTKEDKEQLLTYESYTGKTIKFFSPEGTEKQTSGKILEKLNLLLRDKQKETPFSPEAFTKDEFLKRIAEENKLTIDTLIAEKKYIPGVYVHREEMEIKLREWIGARANIFFIAAEAGSGKTNLLVEMQRQYADRELASLLIRAGRMEKQSLKEQIAYLLNIDIQQGLVNYASIAGTQAQPTFILIDGLNEANNAEEIWQDIIDISKVFIPGSIKFVVTNRANTKAELNRYIVSENDFNFLYGENKDNESELGAYSFWLTALDMQEMKGAWENYATKDKAKFKPQFNFDDIAEFDRGLYNQINNPLILRLFLEIYNGKALPKKGVKHLNIWQDWLKSFSDSEQTFLKLLANEVWLKGENELLLDALLQHETLKPYFTSDIINSPYNRLKNTGWISRYVKDLSGYIGFTVEGSLLYLLALQLKNQKPVIELKFIQSILNNGSKLKKSSIETFLCEQSLNGDLNLVSDLIDSGDENIDVSINPLLFYLKTYGVNTTLEKVLENTSENDWKALNKLDDQLDELQLQVLRKDFLTEIIHKNKFETREELKLGLKAIAIIDNQEASTFITKIDIKNKLLDEDEFLIYLYADCMFNFGKYEQSLKFYEKSLSIIFKKNKVEDTLAAMIYGAIASIHNETDNYEKAHEYHEKAKNINIKLFGYEHPYVNSSNGNIGVTFAYQGNFEKALEYSEKSLYGDLKTYGCEHQKVATSYNNIGKILDNNGDHDKALEYFEKCLAIGLKLFGKEGPKMALYYDNMGNAIKNKGKYLEALDYHQKSLEINLKSFGSDHPDVAISYFNIAECYHQGNEMHNAIEFYKKGYLIKKAGSFPFQISQCYESINEYESALEYYVEAASVWNSKFGIEDEDVIKAISNAIRLAKRIEKLDVLPEWIKNIEL